MNKLKNNFVNFIKNKTVRKVLLLLLVLIIAFIIEFTLSNYKSWKVNKNDYLTDYYANEEPIELKRGKDTKYNFQFPSKGIYAVRFVIKATGSDFKDAFNIEFKAHDEKRSKDVIWTQERLVLPTTDGITETYFVNISVANGYSCEVYGYNISADGIIESVIINPTTNLTRFNFLRFFIIAFIGFLIYAGFVFKTISEFFDIKKKSHAIIIAAFLAIIIVSVFVIGVISDSTGKIDYPLEGDIENYSPYVQQFDAFRKGQLNLDVGVPEKLNKLDNPYDYSARQNAHVSTLWDRAFYQGKYYSYFGIAPIINLYYPSYIFTNSLPSDGAVVTVYSILIITFMTLFLVAYITIYKKKVPLSLLMLMIVAMVLGSCTLLLARSTAHFYYIAVLAGMAYLSMFIFFLLIAIHVSNKIYRRIFYVLASLSYGMIVLSRLNIALLAAFLVVPILFFKFIKNKVNIDLNEEENKTEKVRDKLIDLSCLGSFVLISFIFVFWYNKARFGSMFEFGTTYQMTVSDISKNKISLNNIPQYIYHTFLQPYKVSGKFPFFSIQYEKLKNYGGYIYVDSGMGLFAIPLMLGLLFSIFVLMSKKKSAFCKSLVVSMLLGILVVSILNYDIGGVIYRYTCDLTLIASIASVLMIISFNETIYSHESAKSILILEKIFLVVSIFVCSIVLVSDHSYLAPYSSEARIVLENLFSI